MEALSIIAWAAVIIGGLFAVYNLFHYVLFLLATHPKDASEIGHDLNDFERRQLTEWTPKAEDFLKHDDENRTYDDVFGRYRSENANYSTCIFPRTLFDHPYISDYLLLSPRPGMRLLELGCGSGAAADYLASRCDVEILCVTNSRAQEEICQRKFKKFGGRLQVMVADFDCLNLAEASYDAIYAFESIGYTKDLDAWLARCWRMLKPGGQLLIRSPGSLDFCRREKDYRNVTAFVENWHYNFLGSNLLVYKMRRLGFDPIEYRRVPFWAYAFTWNFIEHLFLWKFRLRMRSMVELEQIIWRTSKLFVFGNGYNIVRATKPRQIAMRKDKDAETIGDFAEARVPINSPNVAGGAQ